MNINKEIAIRVRKYRRNEKYSQENMAEMLGVSRVNYVNMEAGRQNWATHYIYNICRIFNCKPTKLFPKITPIKLKSKTIIIKRSIIKKKKHYLKIKTY